MVKIYLPSAASRLDMPNDTTLKSVFDYAIQGPSSGGAFPTLPALFVTFVKHSANSHPQGGTTSDDLVTYAYREVTLPPDKETLPGELKLWRNVFDPGSPGFFGSPPTPRDGVDDVDSKLTVAISVSDSGLSAHQRKLKGKPISGIPLAAIGSLCENDLFVESRAVASEA